MKYIEAFSEMGTANYLPCKGEISLFLAGGISNCSDWQSEVVELLAGTDLVVLNPRRTNWSANDPDAATKQIIWEHDHLHKATMIMFWFAPETLCPITLFEYGKWLVSNKRLFVGCHPDYQRRMDVEIQTKLERPFQYMHNSIDAMVNEIIFHMGVKW